MITFSKSLERRIAATIERAVGSLSTISFYAGEMPEQVDGPALGEGVLRRDATPSEIWRLIGGAEPERPERASFWRLHDVGGLVLMQGNWQ